MRNDRTIRPKSWLTFLMVAVVVIAACGGRQADRSLILVSAAASLTDAFAEIEEEFEAANPGVDVQLNIGGSSQLQHQILEGAPVDVFASANPTVMQTVVDVGLALDPILFAGSRLQIGVPNGNPARIGGIGDFANGDLLLGLCAETVPCGSLAREILAAVGVEAAIDTSEPDVRSLLTKLEEGELDAGIVYSTDIIASRDVTGIAIPEAIDLIAEYPIAAISDAPNPTGARDFVAFVLSEKGQQIITAHGFTAP